MDEDRKGEHEHTIVSPEDDTLILMVKAIQLRIHHMKKMTSATT